MYEDASGAFRDPSRGFDARYYRKLPENRKLLETAEDDEICVF
jgi:hypothetical protein